MKLKSYSAGIVIASLLISVLFLQINYSIEIKEVVKKQFNEQQLILAQNIARQISNTINELVREINFISKTNKIDKINKIALNILYQYKEKGLITIILENTKEHKKSVIKKENKEKLTTSSTLRIEKRNRYLYIEKFSKTKKIIMKIDLYQLAYYFAHGIRSGKTGYVWIIDDKGTFLYHPNKYFIGKNALEIRKISAPNFDFGEINKIQKLKMLKEKRGTGEYISAWHRKMKGKIKKLLAFTPAKIPLTNNFLSIAVCAPESEIEDIIKSIYNRQFAIQLIIIITIVYTIYIMIKFEKDIQQQLQDEIEKKTKKLKESQKKYKTLIESAPDMIITTDIEWKIETINKATIERLEKTEKEIIGEKLYEILKWDKLTTKKIENQLKKQGKTNIEFQLNRNGNEYIINANITTIDIEYNKEIIVIARDITKLKKLEQQLIYTEKLSSLGLLAAGIAHEINNPLAVAMGFTELLIENFDQDSEEYQDLKIIIKNINQCKKIVESFLNLSRKHNVLEPININDIIEQVVNIIKKPLKKEGIETIVKLQESIPIITGNRNEIQQILLNLIINAQDAMPYGGKLYIKTYTKNDKIIIEVKDTGIGIKQEYINKIFDPFFTTKPESKGTGLGLFITYNIVKKTGASINCYSQENKGTTFTIKIPIKGDYNGRTYISN